MSRAEISVAVRLFLDILETGLVIVTLVDGEQVFTKDRVNSDMSAIVVAIVLLMRANNESRVKRERALQLHEMRREKARLAKIPMSKRGPPWLTMFGVGDSRHFEADKRRAQIVKLIFDLCISGMGQTNICRYLNRRRVPTFSGATKWRCYAVARLLHSKAVFGVLQPYRRVVENGRKMRVPDARGPIEAYFPAILTKELYERAQRAMASRRTRSIEERVQRRGNLFTGLGRCAVCGGNLLLAGSGDSFNYLRCSQAVDWACTNRLGFPYRKVEATFLALDDLLALIRRIVARHLPGEFRLTDDRSTGCRGTGGRRVRSARDGFLARLEASKGVLASSGLPTAPQLRARLLIDVRRIIEGVVLHPDRILTLHMKPDAAGCRIVFVLGPEGLRGIQMKAEAGKVGFIDRSVCEGFVLPIRNGVSSVGADKKPWQPRSVDEAVEQASVIHSAQGDWQAIIHDPVQAIDVIARAENVL